MTSRFMTYAAFFVFSASLLAEEYATLGNLKMRLSAGWQVAQAGGSGDTKFITLENGSDFVTIFQRPGTGLRLADFLTSEAKSLQSPPKTSHGLLEWNRYMSSKTSSGKPAVFVSHFSLEFKGNTYVGFSRAGSEFSARLNADSVLDGTTLVISRLSPLSLTPGSYSGKKYYLGWGRAQWMDPSHMHNQVKYDVMHTHDIFTTDLGGNYASNKMIGGSDATKSNIQNAWAKIGQQIGPEDMYLQYSAGHGDDWGLEVGLSYQQIRDAVLAFPAKEIVVFLMACHAGNIVNLFDKVKSQWQSWDSQGRSLLVMASSRAWEDSGSGPGSKPGGPEGSAGSAFGHALWKALSGSSDGFIDGIKDGFISLQEIRDYTIFRTQQIAGHIPVSTGVYRPHVLMNRVPSQQYLATLSGGTDDLSEDQIQQAIRELNEDMSVQPTKN